MDYIIKFDVLKNPEKSKKIPFLEILMAYVIIFDRLKNPEKSK
jgi:hypothetical protein